MYKQAKTTGLESDKRELKKNEIHYAEEVREAKNAQFEKYISEMDQLGPTEATKRYKQNSKGQKPKRRPKQGPGRLRPSKQVLSLYLQRVQSGERLEYKPGEVYCERISETELEGGLQEST